MAFKEMLYENAMQTPEPEAPFVWTEDAHSLYLTFLEEAFVNDLYLRHYCSLDICGCSPPFTPALPTVATAESPASATPQFPCLVTPPHSEPESRPEIKTIRRCARSTIKGSSSKRKGKWPSQDAGLETQQTFECNGGLQDNMAFFERPGSSSHSDYVVPKVLQRVSKKSRLKAKMDGIDRLGTDQVVPSDYEQG